MEQHELQVPFSQYSSADSLPEDERALLAQALQACDAAYAPYSRFQVGCALSLADGTVLTGNNQENKAYPSGLCAERTALFYAGSQGKGEQVRKIAIRGKCQHKPVNEPVTPCGACRQVMLEYESLAGQPLVILMQGETGQILRLHGVARTLLPFSFNIEF